MNTVFTNVNYAIPTFVETHLIQVGKNITSKSYFVYHTKEKMVDRFNKNKGVETGLISYRELYLGEKNFFMS
jgi:hypothetical protein